MLESGDPIPTYVYLHGDTIAGGPVLPTVFNLVATWGPAEVTLDSEPFENPFDGPAPLWAAHTMTTASVRAADGTVRTVDGEIFNPSIDPANGAIDNDDLEFHLVFHVHQDRRRPTTFPRPSPSSITWFSKTSRLRSSDGLCGRGNGLLGQNRWDSWLQDDLGK